MISPEAITAKLTKLSPADLPAVAVTADRVALTYLAAAHGARVSGDVEALRSLDGQPLAASEQVDTTQAGPAADIVVTLHYGPKAAK